MEPRIIPIIVVALVVVLAGFVISTYNALVQLRNKAREAWSGIDVELQRRADLVPNLVEVVKGYATHETSTFEAVVAARKAAVSAAGPVEAERADNLLTAALQQLFLLAEDHPDLKASSQFLELQRQLAVIEEDIAFARRYHNAVVEEYNTKIQTFPTLLVAGLLGFRDQPFFQIDGGERSVPTVEFDGPPSTTTPDWPGPPMAPPGLPSVRPNPPSDESGPL